MSRGESTREWGWRGEARRGRTALYVQVLVTEQTGIQGPATRQTDCVSAVAGDIPLVHIYIYSQ